MARILITGAADGLGALSAEALLAQGHQVVLHARNAKGDVMQWQGTRVQQLF